MNVLRDRYSALAMEPGLEIPLTMLDFRGVDWSITMSLAKKLARSLPGSALGSKITYVKLA